MRRLAYLAAVVGCGLCYLTFGRWLLWLLLLGLLALPVVSLVLSIPTLRSIRLGVAGPERVKVGEKAELLLMGSCDMPMPPFRGRIFLRDLRRLCGGDRKGPDPGLFGAVFLPCPEETQWAASGAPCQVSSG